MGGLEVGASGPRGVVRVVSWNVKAAFALLVIAAIAELVNLILSGLETLGTEQRIVAGVVGLCIEGIFFVVAPALFGSMAVLGKKWTRWPVGAVALCALAIQSWVIAVGGNVRPLTVMFTIAVILGAILIWIPSQASQPSVR